MHVVQLLKVQTLAAQPLRTIQLAVHPQQVLAAN